MEPKDAEIAQIARESKPFKQSVTPDVMDQADRDDAERVFGADFKPLTSDEATAWRARQKNVSPGRIVWFQAGVGLLFSLAAWAAGNAAAGWSAAWGALSVVFPAMLFARGLARSAATGSSGASLAQLMVWEAVKVVVTLVMLLASPRVVAQLSWPVLVGSFVVTMKMYWLVWWLHVRRPASLRRQTRN